MKRRVFGVGMVLALVAGCAQPGTTYERWQAKQEQKARIEKVRREATEMSKTPVVFTAEEQKKSMPSTR